MKIIESMLAENSCYKMSQKMQVKGLMLHSIGCPQPRAEVFARGWNDPAKEVAVHGFIDGLTGEVWQFLPWEICGWHAGGAANLTHIGVEMGEPDCIKYKPSSATFTVSDADKPAAIEVVKRTYAAAVELFAQLCRKFELDPLGDGVIIGHAEGYARGIASNHGDPEHIWQVFGLTMDGFRMDVYEAMQNKMDKEDEDNVTRYNTVAEMPEYYRAEAQALIDAGALKGGTDGSLNISEDMLRCMIISTRYMDALLKGADTKPSGWAVDELEEAVAAGITDGSRPRGYATREEAAIMVKRASYGNVEELGG